MRLFVTSIFALLFSFVVAQDETPTHGEGEEGSSMGPVAFLWPPDRAWSATSDNTPPCGSSEGPSNRTLFPLSQGSVALSIADDAWKVAFRLAVSNDPTTQAEFDDQVVNNISDIDPGHQCYKLNQLESIEAGTNATIQLEYWAEYEGENNGNNQSFFACADVTFIRTEDFTAQVPCFNVTSDDFNAPSSTASSTGLPAASATGLAATPSTSSASGSSGGLSSGAKAGIAVGSIIGGLALIGMIAFFMWRRGKATGLKGKDEYELRAKTLTTPPAEARDGNGSG
ncbi:hypothetical protein BU26DRAFT_448617 [Trematosphaeria pertusa]|uniref:Copper acquisition factor BIM1-like domain-containing protein n=1 Tax=Trematosphaeria pertusa TaxID=390896 RepID=A0A6A6IXL4_9PLEO|nr:uncharacterized protein BU26DRAFT_448617 [Trematosphaeria pertusa]KAF2255281.1 hypothetical protein BU26DRAFT_448617 [Trematosphaeria pertusa]